MIKIIVSCSPEIQNNAHTQYKNTCKQHKKNDNSAVIQFVITYVNCVPECSAAQSRKPGCDSH